jgi:guanosine-3',5'-bis(diphosphate) 3'-pyrophosphohydrolase
MKAVIQYGKDTKAMPNHLQNMERNKILDKVLQFADNAHGSQMRKYTPERYIVHPIRVMETCKEFDPSLTVLSAALLHDVIEDTAVTDVELLQFLRTVMNEHDAEDTLALTIELTDVYTKAAYPQWNRKQRKSREHERAGHTSPKAQTIKYADIIDNTREITVQDRAFAPRYLRECLEILKVANKGNPNLYKLALTEVQNGLHKLKNH